MSEPTLDNIQPLIDSQETNGANLSVTFKCADTGVEAAASASLKRSSDLKATATRSAKKSMWASLRRSVAGAIADVAGRGAVGKVARDVANQAMAGKQKSTEFSKDEINNGVVDAFKSVQSRFRWDANSSKWVGVKEPDTPFAKMLADAPVAESYDRGILARALVELSAADGDIGEEERAFLQDFITPDLGTIDELAKRETLSAAELAAVDEPARPTLLMLGWACAMSDEDLDDAEVTRLAQLAEGLQLDAEKAEEMRGAAQQFLFEQALAVAYADGRNEEALSEAKSAASKFGIDEERIGALDVGYRKRLGIV